MSLWRLESDYIDVYLLHDPPMEVIKKDAAIHPYRFLARKGRSLTDAAIKLSLAQEGVSSVVVGVMRRAEIIKNVAACKRPLLTKTDLARVDKLND